MKCVFDYTFIICNSSRLRQEGKLMKSDNAKSGMQQAPARSLFNALGFTKDELKKPMVGIVNSYNEHLT